MVKSEIEFITHACYVQRFGDICMMVDPWFEGTAFNHGWQLLVQANMSPDLLHELTHIWISHEHPDHFSPSCLRQIPKERRSQITVLFQKTRDSRIATFCRKQGFNVLEMDHYKRYDLRPGFRVFCGPHRHMDSWLLCEAGDKRILNINDCSISNKAQAQRVYRHTGPVDVLFTQFSYANWVGNEDQQLRRKRHAKELLDAISDQIEVLKAKQVVPFASFVCFSHPENQYLNQDMNSIRTTSQHIESRTSAEAIVLYPGDRWVPGSSFDSEKSIVRYEEASLNFVPEKIQLKSYPFDELQPLYRKFRTKMYARNWGAPIQALRMAGFFSDVEVFLDDLQHSVSIGLDPAEGFKKGKTPRESCNIAMRSDSLAFALKHEFGAETLYVNGRYRVFQGNERDFFRLFYVSILNNQGFNFPIGAIEFVWREKIAWRLPSMRAAS